jgi:hypothetical protein
LVMFSTSSGRHVLYVLRLDRRIHDYLDFWPYLDPLVKPGDVEKITASDVGEKKYRDVVLARKRRR